MAKIIAWLIVIFVVLFALRMINFRNARAQRAKQQADAAPTGRKGTEVMVRCVRCGVYLPRAEAQSVSGGYACAAGECGGHA
jgi:hypothetical protein